MQPSWADTSRCAIPLTIAALLLAECGTAVRLVDAANAFLWDKSLREGMQRNFAKTGGALIYKLLNDALCRNAAEHHAACVDVRPSINGRSLDQPGDENSPESMRAVADALLAAKVPERDGGAP